MLFTYVYHVPLLPPYFAAVLGTTAEIVLPSLIILGLGGRIIIALLFIFNITAVISYPFLWTTDGAAGLNQHINWGCVLGLLMCHGAGSFSIDKLLTKHFVKKT